MKRGIQFAALAIAFALLPRAAYGLQFFEPVQPPRPFRVMVHRGAMHQAPENTVAAFEKAIRLGVDYVEFDARTTKDGRYFILHEWGILSKELIDHCHARGVKVFSDSMGRERIEEYTKAMEWGIDLIQTDFPLRVMRAAELLTSGTWSIQRTESPAPPCDDSDAG